MPTNTSRPSIQIICLFFFCLFLAGNTKFQRIWRKGMPYNAIWIINLLNEDEFDIQNNLYQEWSVDNTMQDMRALYHTRAEFRNGLIIHWIYISKIITSLLLRRIPVFEYFAYSSALLGYEIIFSGRSGILGTVYLDTSSCVTSACTL